MVCLNLSRIHSFGAHVFLTQVILQTSTVLRVVNFPKTNRMRLCSKVPIRLAERRKHKSAIATVLLLLRYLWFVNDNLIWQFQHWNDWLQEFSTRGFLVITTIRIQTHFFSNVFQHFPFVCEIPLSKFDVKSLSTNVFPLLFVKFNCQSSMP
jgi:hypothetical protein